MATTSSIAEIAARIAGRIFTPDFHACTVRPQLLKHERSGNWRKLVGVEPTCDTLTGHTPDLKSGPSAGQD